jgi:hypothetical protein
MTCIRCGLDSKKKDRVDGHCPGCHKPFAFERGDLFTDMALKRAIDAVSSEGRVKWGVEHLYYELCRRRTRAVGRVPLVVAVVAAVAAAVMGTIAYATGEPMPGLIAAAAGAAAIVALRYHFKKTVPVTRPQFDVLWGRFVSVHGEPKGRIVRRPAPSQPRSLEPDVGDYSFDRVVVCDRARTVDLLLANNFHFENNCAVLSVGGYPPGPFETVRAMLRRNPKLSVFALHDATPGGCRMTQRLAADPSWFQGHARVVDVGLRPSQSGPFRGLFLPAPGGRLAAGDGLSAAEASWLTWYQLELAAIRPEQVLKRLFRAINRKEATDTRDTGGDSSSSGSGDGGWGDGEGDGVEVDGESFGSNASDSDGGADSFG